MMEQIHFQDHAGFQRNVLFWTVAGAGGALLALFLRGFPMVEAHGYTVMLGATGLAIGGASGWLRGRWQQVLVGAVLGSILGGAAAMVGQMPSLAAYAPLVGAALAGGGAGFFWGPSEAPPYARALGFAMAAVCGVYVVSTFLLQDSGVALLQKPGIQDAVSGGLLGFFLSLGGAVGRVQTAAKSVVEEAWEEIEPGLAGDMRTLAAQGVKLHHEVMERCESQQLENGDSSILEETRRVSQETILRLVKLAERWCKIEEGVDQEAVPRLEARLEALEEKLSGSTDKVIVAEYSAAAKSVREQLEGFGRVDLARERLVARMHRCLASLERINLLLLQVSTTSAQDASMSLQPELNRLDEMSDDLSWQTFSVEELCAEEEVSVSQVASGA